MDCKTSTYLYGLLKLINLLWPLLLTLNYQPLTYLMEKQNNKLSPYAECALAYAYLKIKV